MRINSSGESALGHLADGDRVVAMARGAVVVPLRRAAALAEDALHEGPWTTALDIAEDGEVVDLGCLPALLDAVVDESHEASRDDDTGGEMLELIPRARLFCV